MGPKDLLQRGILSSQALKKLNKRDFESTDERDQLLDDGKITTEDAFDKAIDKELFKDLVDGADGEASA